MHYTLHFLFALFNLQLLALASLYPTCPVASTVFESGNKATLTWTDTQYRPQLSEMGPLRIELCVPNSTNCSDLAENVPPMSRAHTVLIPGGLLRGLYVILFSGLVFHDFNPPTKFWTADFNITSPVTDTTVSYKPELDDVKVTDRPLTLVLPTATLISEVAQAKEVPAATTIFAGPLPQGGGGGAGLNRVHSSNTANPRKRIGSEFQFADFRLLLIVWPALVGISLAS